MYFANMCLHGPFSIGEALRCRTYEALVGYECFFERANLNNLVPFDK